MEVAVRPRTRTTLLAWVMTLLLAMNIVPLTAFASNGEGGEPDPASSATAFDDDATVSNDGGGSGAVAKGDRSEPSDNGDANRLDDEGASQGDSADLPPVESADTPVDATDSAEAAASSAGDAVDADEAEKAALSDEVELRDGGVDIKTLWPAGTPDADRSILGGMTLGFSDMEGNPLPAGQDPTIDSIIHLAFPLELPASVTAQIQAGDYYAFQLPDTLTIAKGIHQVALADPSNESVVYANFEVSPSQPGTPATVKIVFTDAIRGQGDVEGEMSFSGGLNAKTIGKPGTTEIKLPYEQNVPPVSITIAPATDGSVSKAGTFDQPTNPTKVIWAVDVNKGLKQMTNGSIAESLPLGLTYESVDVYEVPVDFYGNVVGSPGDAGWTQLTGSAFTASADGSTVTLNAPYDSTNQAFRFVYTTTISDDMKPPTGGDATFTNTATFHSEEAGDDGLPAQATVTAHFGKVLDKKGATYDPSTREITWKVMYNYGGHRIPASEAWIDDICDYPDLEYVDGSVTVQKMKFNAQGNAVVDNDIAQGGGTDQYAFSNDPANHRITVSFNGDVDYPVLVTYKTKVTSIVDASKTYVNTALTHGTPPPVAHDRITIGQHNIVKRFESADLNDKTIMWQIDINESRYELRNFTLADTLVLGLSHTLASSADVEVYDVTAGALVSEVQNADQDGYMIDMATDANGNHIGFNLVFCGSYTNTDHVFKITYKTKYDAMNNPPDGSQEFINQASMTWIGTDGNPHHNDYTAKYRPTPPDGNNGAKSGSYNATDKSITWMVLVDYARTGLKNASIKDAILPGQTYVDGSLKVYSYSLLSNGTVVHGPELTPEEMAQLGIDLPTENNNETLTIDFPDGDNLYWIELKTSVEGTVIEKTYDNTAVFHNETPTASDTSLKAEVSVKHGGSLVEKSGVQDADGYAAWTLTVNPSNSTLEDVVVTDTPSSNQLVDLDSIAINPTTVDADGNLAVDYSTKLVESVDYTVDYVQDASGVWQLVIAFARDIDSAYVVSYRATIYADESTPVSAATNAAKVTGTNVKQVTDDTTSSLLVQLSDGAGILKGSRKDMAIHKADAGGNDLAGAKFQLYNNNGQPVGGVAVSNDQGMISYPGIVTGTYTLKEVEPAPGYTMTEELAAGVPIALEAGSGTFELENDLTEVSFVKQNTEGDPVQGARFALDRLDGSDWVAVTDLPAPLNLESGADGSVVVRGLSPGHYRLSETATPYPYVLGDPVEFDVSYRSDAVKIVDPVVLPAYVNERFAGVLSLLKTDEVGTPLPGARFELRTAAGALVDDSIVTGSDGRATVAGLSEGSYVLTETQAPKGYQLDATAHPVEVVYDANGQTIELTMVNKAEPTPPEPYQPDTPLKPGTPPSPPNSPMAKALAATGDDTSALGVLSIVGLAAAGLIGSAAYALRRRKAARPPKA